ncbi:hypothetical protein K437DRAFT_149178 [Tilletiaria anomala UBC 951]|uniref:Uncharacterized protein n=1 Tax=Tilletiaria anomala (strain ATCC 24038 / CBS 436.72 / UBC 951) TaxID=1037660 RepID=A0A066WFS4_TILAU|nr:uncharacterized protein K437DRAFT_149178 [Tilletiaria anomala UBC 951]KDN52822.1 hypothetical protein K437DRAFT_149178 [Tilletiaria anomala UBC 951]
MSSLLQRAKEKAQEAAHQLQQAAANAQSSNAASKSNNAGSSNANDNATGLSSSTYTSSLPHLLRHGIASFDPRLQSNRSFYVLNNAMKAVSIDHEALKRETHALAMAAYNYGQQHVASTRPDGVGDEVIVDVMDRIAYVLSLTGDLHAEHVSRVESSRKTFKATISSAPLESQDLLSHRSKRTAIVKELQTLMPERAKAPGMQSEKVKEMEDALRKLEQDDKAKEEEAAKGKRQAVRQEWEGYFDSLIELGEKLALTARYGKLIAQQVPATPERDPIEFPADRTPRDRSREATWSGAVRVAEIRAAVGPAIQQLQVDKHTLPQVPSMTAGTGTGAGAASGPFADNTSVFSGAASSLGRSDTVSFGVSHAAELKAASSSELSLSSGGGGIVAGHERVQLSNDGAVSHLAPPGSTAQLPSSSPQLSHTQLYGSSPSGFASGGPLSARINMNPIDIPTSPTSGIVPYHRRTSSFNRDSPPPVPGRPTQHPPQQHRVPPLPGNSSHSSNSSFSPSNVAFSPSSPSRLAHGIPGHERHPPLAPGDGASYGQGDVHHYGGADLASPMTAPDEPTVAETGSPIVGQGGPKTGYLPRRKSSVVPSAASTAGSSSTGGVGGSTMAGISSSSSGVAASPYETTAEARARKDAEAERERQAAATSNAQSGIDDDLPPYSERGLK